MVGTVGSSLCLKGMCKFTMAQLHRGIRFDRPRTMRIFTRTGLASGITVQSNIKPGKNLRRDLLCADWADPGMDPGDQDPLSSRGV